MLFFCKVQCVILDGCHTIVCMHYKVVSCMLGVATLNVMHVRVFSVNTIDVYSFR